ncbi:Eco57I restriction-modification methylase domain-containing protein [Pseudoclavibacter caeni]|uniref:site-specific DNA-methyltransferase (adenine-specific) n=1 Tax=Pseudoclavibacter caeni TaxID=908846 RepID=A0A7C8FXH0_9MICO|nr:DNA methyltransferase [Pseudoclavibacter caeni]KAB1631365.1 class I SAM-dependent DNA methyltransferase [Pseudoclavibacter caeni]NYJ96767.1 hypothetical protein [Pseudoclavibacter caeni]
MAASDAIIIGESWISEHFFTSDSTKESFQAKVHEREQEWKQQRADGLESPLSRFEHIMPQLASVFGSLSENDDGIGGSVAVAAQTLDDLYLTLRRALGYEAAGLTRHTSGSLHLIGTEGIDGAPLALVDARFARSVEDVIRRDAPDAPADNLLLPTALPESGPLTNLDTDEKTLEFTNTARLLSELFIRDGGPRFALVFAGGWALVAERERWAEGRYLAINLQLVVERNDRGNGKELNRAVTCLDAESLAPDPDGEIWWAGVLEDSVRHTVGVSSELRDGVREAIEIIANDVVRQRRIKGLEPLPDHEAQPLAKQSLRFLYRILFLLYAEASPELGVLPVGAPEYESGYSLDRLRDLTLVTLTSERSREGRHLYESLNRLFTLVDQGNAAKQPVSPAPVDAGEGLHFEALRADLFRPDRTALIDEVGLSNVALQRVLDRLLLTRSKQSGRRKRAERGFISYAELGINQLGAVYEGLMSYTGFFATEPLYEVARNANPEKGSWVIPVSRVDALEGTEKELIASSLVRVEDAQGQSVPRRYETGEFVFRLAGRERQQSASYYSPEVLTRFTVSQALAELLDQDGVRTPAREILQITVCEPALGSGAFAIEAVRQLAAAYLKRRQEELDTTIDPDEYPRELQKAKAYIALHQTYGVDLNATAVELAEISLWLDTMVAGLQGPWFGLHLRRGNSLIGARHAFYSKDAVKSRRWLKEEPDAVPLTTNPAGRIPHFVLPAVGWGSAVDAKEAKELAPETLKRLKGWRKTVTAKPSTKQLDRLQSLGYRVEALWQLALRRLEIAESQIRRSVDVWGAEDLPEGGEVSREKIEAALADPDGAYGRLRRVMDAWCALWYWPLTVDEADWPEPPTLDEWLDTLEALLGKDYERSKIVRKMGDTQVMLTPSRDWDALDDAEKLDLGYASARSVEMALAEHPWLNTAADIAEQQGFFHWELDFAKVFAHGGFDLQVGNPPWVRPQFKLNDVLSEFNPLLGLSDIRKASNLSAFSDEVRRYVLHESSRMTTDQRYYRDQTIWEFSGKGQLDLYMIFMWQCHRHMFLKKTMNGVVGLIHQESHLTSEKNYKNLRAFAYLTLRRHWEFTNELKLFDIQNQKHFSVNVYSNERGIVDFVSAVGLLLPVMLENSWLQYKKRILGGSIPPLKNTETGTWNISPHPDRIIRVTDVELEQWARYYPELTDYKTVPFSYLQFGKLQGVLDAINSHVRIDPRSNEAIPVKSVPSEGGDKSWWQPKDVGKVVLQGSHFNIWEPVYKTPNSTMKSSTDWRDVSLRGLPVQWLPACVHRAERAPAQSTSSLTVIWRKMIDTSGSRSLIPAALPLGHSIAQSVAGVSFTSGALGIRVLASMGTLLTDFYVKARQINNASVGTFFSLPILFESSRKITNWAVLRVGRLGALRTWDRGLWDAAVQNGIDPRDSWTKTHTGMDSSLFPPSLDWTPSLGLRCDSDRYWAELEVDVLACMACNLTVEDICSIYRVRFGALRDSDSGKGTYAHLYDANGWLVPSSVLKIWRQQGDNIAQADRTITNASGNTYTYELPFVTYDREEDMRVAYAEFERRLQDQGER